MEFGRDQLCLVTHKDGLDQSQLVPRRANNGYHTGDGTPQTQMVHHVCQLSGANCVWNFESHIKMVSSCWRKYVKYLVRQNPGVPLKKLLQTYSKKEYEEFKKNPKAFV